MPFLYNSLPPTWYLNNSSPYLENLQVYLYPASYSGSGNIWENTQNSTEATIFNSPTYNTTTGFTLNGTTQYMSLPSVSNVTNFTNNDNYTIEFWAYINSVQLDTATVDNCIVEKWNSSSESAYPYVARLIRSSSTINFASFNGSINPISSTTANLNNWAQYVGVFNHQINVLSVYKNGQLSSTGSLNIGGTISNSSTLNIGRRANPGGISGTNHFTGRIGIVRIYNSDLTASQVLQNYNANKSQFGL
jgi:hypothetical protein